MEEGETVDVLPVDIGSRDLCGGMQGPVGAFPALVRHGG